MQLNLDIFEARTVMIPPYQHLNLWIIGCGGTGSFLSASQFRNEYKYSELISLTRSIL
ncbi:MAG: hypothetical protein QNJ46_24960 [Leptolyngbyaceae cyanobacterium MO_188.B28]|nr:hypothetical protein [Leptolyngbyaceae cyanobacterium MO_188.B28]